MKLFLVHAVEIIRSRALRSLQKQQDLALLMELVAHVYAVACKVLNYGVSSLKLEVGLIPNLNDLQAVENYLAELPSDIDRNSLYASLIEALKIIEYELGEQDSVWGVLPQITVLAEEGPCALSGKIAHYFGPTNALKLLREQRLARTSQIPAPVYQPSVHPSQQLDRLRIFWNSDAQQPEVRIRRPPSESPLNTSICLEAKAGFRILLCHLELESCPQFKVVPPGDLFRTIHSSSIYQLEKLHSLLCRIFEYVRNREVHLVVFPELMICKATREYIKKLLRGDNLSAFPWAVLAGSFHIDCTRELDNQAFVANESLLIDSTGGTLLYHHKRAKFAVPTLATQAASVWFPEPFNAPAHQKQIVEGIEHQGHLEILETSIGRVAVAICADCIAPDLSSLRTFLDATAPDFLLITAMTPETDRFERVMADLAERSVTSVLVNAYCAKKLRSHDAKGELLYAAANLGLFEPDGAPPSRVRWCSGKQEAEIRYFKPADSKKGWRSLCDEPEGIGVEVLRDVDGQALGLFLDLGSQARWMGE